MAPENNYNHIYGKRDATDAMEAKKPKSWKRLKQYGRLIGQGD